MKLLILDGTAKNTLGIVRHLGKKKSYIIHAASYKKNTLALLSRYVDKKVILPDARINEQEFLNELLNVLKNETYDALIPVSYISFKICSKYQDRIKGLTGLCITSHDNIELSQDKARTNKLANELGIPFPKSLSVNPEEIDLSSTGLDFPIVVKTPLEVGHNFVRYSHNLTQLKKHFSEVSNSLNNHKGVYPLLQEYIDGPGAGYFAFYDNGKCLYEFMHKRIREYPVTGGSSTCAETFNDPVVAEYGRKILDKLNWNGVAMVEFKQSSDSGIYYLMEINGKLWGSLDLPLSANVDFIEYMINQSTGAPNESILKVEQVRFQWLLNGELFHFIERPWHIFGILKDLFRSKNDFYWSDPKPNLFQLLNVFAHYLKKLKQ